MLINLVAFAVLLITAINAAEDKGPAVQHLELNGIHLIDTTDTNYALTATSFIDQDWLTLSVNGDQATFISPTCQTTIKNVEALNEDEKSIIREVYNKALTADDEEQSNAADGRTRASASRFGLDGSWWWFTSRSVAVMRFSVSDYNFCKNDDANFTAAKRDMPNNIARVLVHNEIVTFAYHNLKVMMKPISCLDDTEQELLKELEKLIKQQLKEHQDEAEVDISESEKIEEPTSAGSR